MNRTPASRTSSRTKVPPVPAATSKTHQQQALGSGPSLASLDYSFALMLRAANRSEHTISIYRTAVAAFAAWLESEHMTQAVDAISREHVERFIVSLQEQGYRPATIVTHFRGLRRFFAWCVEESEITVSPMARIHEPAIPVTPPTVISHAELQALLGACEGRSFEKRRDMAILRILIDTGVRRSEVCGMQLVDVDWPAARILVRGKGDRSRYVKIGKKALRALDSYRRIREHHPFASLPDLWLSRQGPLSVPRLHALIKLWAEAAGLENNLHAHLFRHTFAHLWLEGGGQEQDLMELGGWRSASVMYRYGQSLRAARAMSAHERLSPGDRL